MFFEEKVEEINAILGKLGDDKIAVWCLGLHTEKLMEFSRLLKCQIVFFIDRDPGFYVENEAYGKPVYGLQEADLSCIEHIVISTFKYQDEILLFLKQKGLVRKAVTIYSTEDEGEFYLLPQKNNQDFYFTGNYDSWGDAEESAAGYGDENIVQKVLDATRVVKEGKASFERDSVLFYKKEFNYRLVSVFGILASRKKQVSILDFGGALGSEYWKNREFLYKFGVKFTWNIVEQDNYVEAGKKEIANQELRFYSNVSQLNEKADLVILSSVLQYLPDYKEILAELMDLEADYILIERQAVCEQTRICVQHVGENIYSASYPLRILAEQELLCILEKKYTKIAEFGSEADGDSAYTADGKKFYYKGYLMERKNENT